MPRGIFVCNRGHVDGGRGGVQACTQEYIAVIEAAGIDLTILRFNGDRRLSTRLLQQFNSSPYFRPVEPLVMKRIAAEADRLSADFIFLNQVSLSVIATGIRRLASRKTHIVLLSHGLESTDLVHLIRLRGSLPLSGRTRPTTEFAIGSAIRNEVTSRSQVDAVVALTPFDAALERWVGASRVGWLPRVIASNEIDWRPAGDRLGYVGTLDHAPNLEGLVLALNALSASEERLPRVRVIGGPPRIGAWLTHRFQCVDYLGALQDADLIQEASTWSATLHPVFCSARGCSMKLATAIGWRIPIVTTPQGRRGYEWRDGSLLEAADPKGFASLALQVLRPNLAKSARADVARVAASSPTLAEVGARARSMLDFRPAMA